VNVDVVIHAYETTQVEARAVGRDVDVRIGGVRIWLPREVARNLNAAVVEAIAAGTDEGGVP
jgi:hypothetical protein